MDDFELYTSLRVKFSDNSIENISSTLHVHASNLSPGGTENELHLPFIFFKETENEQVTINEMRLTFSDLSMSTEDNNKYLRFNSNSSKYYFATPAFSKNTLPISLDIVMNDGNLTMTGGSTELIPFQLTNA